MNETHKCTGCHATWSHDLKEVQAIEDRSLGDAKFLAMHACPSCGRFSVYKHSDRVSKRDLVLQDTYSEVFAFVSAAKIDMATWEGSDLAKAEIVRLRESHPTMQGYAKKGTTFDAAIATVINLANSVTAVWMMFGENPADVSRAFGLPAIPVDDLTLDMLVEAYAEGLGEIDKVFVDGKWIADDNRKVMIECVRRAAGPNAEVFESNAELRKLEIDGFKVLDVGTIDASSILGMILSETLGRGATVRAARLDDEE